MSSNNVIITDKASRYNEISQQAYRLLKNLSDFYSSEVTLLVNHLYSKGYTVQQVADILGVSKQAVSLRYPKNGGRS